MHGCSSGQSSGRAWRFGAEGGQGADHLPLLSFLSSVSPALATLLGPPVYFWVSPCQWWLGSRIARPPPWGSDPVAMQSPGNRVSEEALPSVLPAAAWSRVEDQQIFVD